MFTTDVVDADYLVGTGHLVVVLAVEFMELEPEGEGLVELVASLAVDEFFVTLELSSVSHTLNMQTVSGTSVQLWVLLQVQLLNQLHSKLHSYSRQTVRNALLHLHSTMLNVLNSMLKSRKK